MTTGEVVAVCISKSKGERKTPVPAVTLRPDHGIVGDAHAGDWHRQVSLLAIESIEKMQRLGLSVDAGDFASVKATTAKQMPFDPPGPGRPPGMVASHAEASEKQPTPPGGEAVEKEFVHPL